MHQTLRRSIYLAVGIAVLGCGADSAPAAPAGGLAPRPLDRLVLIGPPIASIFITRTVRLSATLRGDFGAADSTIVWKSLNTSVATVDASGLVSGVTAGTATITATAGTVTGTAAITVTPVPVGDIAVTAGANQTGFAGSPLPVVPAFRVLDAFGQPLVGARVTFAVSDGALAKDSATTDSNGAVSPGVWTLGPSAGEQYAYAELGSSIGRVQATALPRDTSVYVASKYRVSDITNDVGEGFANARLNELGQVGGTASASDSTRSQAVVWQDGVVNRIQECRWMFDLNDSGQVLCRLRPGVGIWDHGSIARVPVLDGFDQDPYATAYLNSAGTISGTKGDLPGCTGSWCVFVVTGGKLTVVGTGLDGSPMYAAGLNNAGDVAINGFGYSYSRRSYVLPHDGAAPILYMLGTGALRAINEKRWLVGSTQGHPAAPIATMWRGADTIQFGVGSAWGLNNLGDAVGNLERPYADGAHFNPSVVGPFLWDGHAVKILSRAAVDAGWIISSAVDINDAGDILVIGDNAQLGRYGHYLLLRPAGR